MEKITIQYYKTKFGELILGSFDNQLCLCDWRYRRMRSSIDRRIQKGLDCPYEIGDSKVIQTTITQLQEYLSGSRKVFDVPLLWVGTDFQKKVWNELINIPFGETMSYLQLSRRLQNQKAIRAVASANGANALSIIVPCHRIIGSKGELVGYAGGLNIKKKLLELEGARVTRQIKMFE